MPQCLSGEGLLHAQLRCIGPTKNVPPRVDLLRFNLGRHRSSEGLLAKHRLIDRFVVLSDDSVFPARNSLILPALANASDAGGNPGESDPRTSGKFQSVPE